MALTSWREWTGRPRDAALATAALSAVALTAALFTAPTRDPMRWYYWSDRSGTPIEREAEMSTTYFTRARAAARRAQLRDSLRALARPGVVIAIDPFIKGDSATKATARMRAAWAAFGITSPAVPVVLSLRPYRTIFGPGGFDVPSFYAMPLAPGEPCVASVQSFETRSKEAEVIRGMRNSMYACALVARHGLPGPGVQAELRRIGWNPTPLGFWGEWYPWWYSGIASTISVAGGGTAYLSCRAGLLAGCDELARVNEPRTREFLPGMNSTTYAWRRSYSGTANAQLIALLEASIPRAQFDRVWRDARPFAVAIESVTGRSLGQWAGQSLLRRERPLVAVFSPTSPLALRAVLFTLLAAAAGMAVQSRRTVA